MKKFTKSFLTFALFCVAGSVSAQEDVIVDFDASFYHNWSEVSGTAVDNGPVQGAGLRLGEQLGGNTAVWGNLTGAVPYLDYANITDYSELRIVGTPGLSFRVMCNRLVNEGPIYEINPKISDDSTLIIKISDLKHLNGGTACNYVCLQAIKTGHGQSGTVKSIKIVKPGDPLSVPKDALRQAINEGKKQKSIGKTTESFNNLTNAITAGETALGSATTADALNAATKTITDAISALKLADGYTTLTQDMFKHWDDNYVPTTPANTGCIYSVGGSTGQPYGDGSVVYLNFADISEYSKLILTVATGTPRIMLNRIEPLPVGTEGYDANGGHFVQIIDAPVEGIAEVDLTQYDYAHLNAIKGANYGEVTVNDMLLYRTLTVGDAKYATFGSLYKSAKLNGVTAYAAKYADGKISLTQIDNATVPAGKGVVVEATAAGSYAPTFDVEASDIESDLLVSNGTVAGNGSSIYAFANGKHGVGFYLLGNGVKIPAGKAYLNTAAGAREFIGFANEATAIKTVETAKADGAIYNLAGQQVKKAQKGIYIINGKKAIVK